MRFSALGDVAMTLPVVYSLAKQYPDVHIDFATTPFFARLFIAPPSNLEVHAYDLKKNFKGIAGAFRLFKKLNSLHPDAVADLHNVGRTWIIDTLFRLKGVKTEMVDKMRKKRRLLIKSGVAQKPFIDRYFEVFSILGLPVKPEFKSLEAVSSPKDPDIRRPAVGIAPFARYYNKTYPPDMTLQLSHLLSEKDINVYFFGGRGEEAEKLEEMASEIKNSESLAGRFTLEEELALMKQMDVMVSMDSANHHLASLMGTPVVSIWGSTTPACGFMAYGQKAENALVAGVSCQPCTVAGSPLCNRRNLDCFRQLEPQLIADKIISLLKEKK